MIRPLSTKLTFSQTRETGKDYFVVIFKRVTYLSNFGFALVFSCFFGFAEGSRFGLAGFFALEASGNVTLDTTTLIIVPSTSPVAVEESAMSGLAVAASLAFC